MTGQGETGICGGLRLGPEEKCLKRSVLQEPSYRPTLERATGIEPVLFAWEAKVLPLNYARLSGKRPHDTGCACAARRINLSQSLLPKCLAART